MQRGDKLTMANRDKEILLFAAVFQFFVWAVPPQNLLIKLVLSELESTRYLVLGKFTKLSKILKQGNKYLGITSAQFHLSSTGLNCKKNIALKFTSVCLKHAFKSLFTSLCLLLAVSLSIVFIKVGRNTKAQSFFPTLFVLVRSFRSFLFTRGLFFHRINL